MDYKKRYYEVESGYLDDKSFLILSSAANIQYLTGIDVSFTTRDVVLIIQPKVTPTLLLNELYRENCEFENLISPGIIEVLFYEDADGMLKKLLEMLPLNMRLLIDHSFSLSYFNQISQKRYDLKLEIIGFVEKMRVIKSEEEIDLLKKSALYSDLVMGQLQQLIKLPCTERYIQQQIIQIYSQYDIDRLNFPPIVAANENSVFPHHQSIEIGLKENSLLLIDMGCVYKGYRSDMTRMFLLNDFRDKEFSEDYKILKGIQERSLDIIKPGEQISKVDLFVREELNKKNLLQFYNHNLGHGIGLASYEYPYIHYKADGIFEEGMSLTIGPGIYKKEKYGIRLEDVVVVNKSGVEKVTNYSKELNIINEGDYAI